MNKLVVIVQCLPLMNQVGFAVSPGSASGQNE